MVRFIWKICLFASALLIVALVMDRLFTDIFKQGRTVKAQWVGQMQDDHYDLVIIGSSRAWWNIDMNMINEKCSMNSINISNNHYGPLEMLLAFQQFISGDNTADHVLLQLDYRNCSQGRPPTSVAAYDFLPWIHDPRVFDILKGTSEEWIWLRNIPFARYGLYNSKWGPEEFAITLLGERNSIFDGTGSFFVDREFRGYPYYQLDLVPFQISKEIVKIIEICKARNIRIDIFTAPYYRLMLPNGARERFHDVVRTLDVPFHDHSFSLDSTIHFDNNYHLSYTGGQLFTQMLIDEVICPKRDTDQQPRAVQ